MVNKIGSDSKYITKKHLDKTIGKLKESMDKKFAESYEVMDKKFAESYEVMNKKFAESYEVMNKKFAESDAIMDRRFTESYQLIDKKFKAFEKVLDFRLAPIEKAQTENEKFKTNVLQSLDWLVGAFKKFEEEHTVISSQCSDIQDRLDDHEKRLVHIESATILQ